MEHVFWILLFFLPICIVCCCCRQREPELEREQPQEPVVASTAPFEDPEQRTRLDVVKECLEFRTISEETDKTTIGDDPEQGEGSFENQDKIVSTEQKKSSRRISLVRNILRNNSVTDSVRAKIADILRNTNHSEDDSARISPTTMKHVSIDLVLESIRMSAGNTRHKDSCSICLEPFKVGDKVARMKQHQDKPCSKHWFKEDCIVEWLQSHDECPLSRIRMIPESDVAAAAGASAPSDPMAQQHMGARRQDQERWQEEQQELRELQRRQQLLRGGLGGQQQAANGERWLHRQEEREQQNRQAPRRDPNRVYG